MTIYIINYVRVYGKNEDLRKFKRDVASGYSDFSFAKIVPPPEEPPEYVEDPFGENYSDWTNWLYKHWGTLQSALDVELKNESNHLRYRIDTVSTPPLPIYHKLIETYTELNFEIVIYDEFVNWKFVLTTEQGQYTEDSLDYIKFVPLGNNQTKFLHYRGDVVTNTLKVIREQVFDESTKIDFFAASVLSDSNDIKVKTDDTYSDDGLQ
jgi:hypothetical protein